MTLNDRLEQFFRQHPGEWIDGKRLAEIAGGYGWRSRCSDLRTQRGLTIANRQRRMTKGDGSTYVISEYRLVPTSLLDCA